MHFIIFYSHAVSFICELKLEVEIVYDTGILDQYLMMNGRGPYQESMGLYMDMDTGGAAP